VYLRAPITPPFSTSYSGKDIPRKGAEDLSSQMNHLSL
jgi:hypothetical protein